MVPSQAIVVISVSGEAARRGIVWYVTCGCEAAYHVVGHVPQKTGDPVDGRRRTRYVLQMLGL